MLTIFLNISNIIGLLFAFGLTITTLFVFTSLIKQYNINDKCAESLFYFLNIIIYGVIGVYLDSSLICAISVIFLMLLIFAVAFIFCNNEGIIAMMFASWIITCLGILLYLLTQPNNLGITFGPLVFLFAPGTLLVGYFVFFISSLVASDLYYFHNTKYYICINIITITLYLLCMYIGNLYEIDQFVKATNITIICFVLMKFYELLKLILDKKN